MMKIKGFKIRQSNRHQQWRSYIIGLNGETVFWTEYHPDQRDAIKACRLVDPDGQFSIEIYDQLNVKIRTIEGSGTGK